MNCTEAQSRFSLYMDGVLSGVEMHALSQHLDECAACQAEYKMLEDTRLLVSSVGRIPAPAGLDLRLRVALSNARAQSLSRKAQAYAVRLENLVNAFMFPAAAGILTAVIFFAVLIGFFVPAQVGPEEVPATFYTPPHLTISAYADSQLSVDASVMVETDVDATGRVENYRILSGQDSPAIRAQLDRALLFTLFEPARTFGRPSAGKAVLSFSRINVKG